MTIIIYQVLEYKSEVNSMYYRNSLQEVLETREFCVVIEQAVSFWSDYKTIKTIKFSSKEEATRYFNSVKTK